MSNPQLEDDKTLEELRQKLVGKTILSVDDFCANTLILTVSAASGDEVVDPESQIEIEATTMDILGWPVPFIQIDIK